MARNVNMGAHPYNDMKIGVPKRNKIGTGGGEPKSFCGSSSNILAKLDKEYTRLLTKGTKKQQEQYLRSVYYKA